MVNLEMSKRSLKFGSYVHGRPKRTVKLEGRNARATKLITYCFLFLLRRKKQLILENQVFPITESWNIKTNLLRDLYIGGTKTWDLNSL